MNLRSREELLQQRAFDELLGKPTVITLWEVRASLELARVVRTLIDFSSDYAVKLTLWVEYLDPAKWEVCGDSSTVIGSSLLATPIKKQYQKHKTYLLTAFSNYDDEQTFRSERPHLNLPRLETCF